ncbi:MAG: GDSL family lipase [Clostridia bacterium]|nr:GDSL family lipase [Clostridia bacterium]
MKITELLKNKEQDRHNNKPVTIAFIGDSVTQGCFECYMKNETALETVFDYKSAYSTRVGEILHTLYPSAQVNIINSGISGDNARGGALRFERDVLSYNPDLVVISFGLNDSVMGKEGLCAYVSALEEMFSALKERNIEAIFLTENTMCMSTSPHLKDEKFINLSKTFGKVQLDGTLKEYFDAAKSSCEKFGVKVCDLYAIWESMAAAGVNTTELLSNKLNHPIREFHYYMAMKIVETILMN